MKNQTSQHLLDPLIRLGSLARRGILYAALLAALTALTYTVQATDRGWTGAVSDAWTEPNNWSPAGVPGVNDTAYFMNDSTVRRTIVMPNSSFIFDMPVATVRSLVFFGGGYTLHVPPGFRGRESFSTLSLGTGILSLSTDSRTNYIEPSVVIRASQDFSCQGSGALVINGNVNLNEFTLGLNSGAGNQWVNGVIYGNGALVKKGNGLAFLGGGFNNYYVGTTWVTAGELVLIKSFGAIAVPGDLIIDNAASPYNAVSLNAPDQIADSATVTVGGNGWFIPLGRPETIGSLVLAHNGQVDLRSSILTLNNNVDVLSGAAATIGGGILSLSASNHTFNVESSASLRILANLASETNSAPGFDKVGPGTLVLAAANSYAGVTTVHEGTLMAAHNSALGDADPATGATVVFDGASLQLAGINGLIEPVILNGTSASPMPLLRGSGVMMGDLLMNGPENFIGNANPQDQIEIQSAISGPGGLTVQGNGTVQFSGTTSNTYAGLTRVMSGTLQLSKTAPARAIPGSLSIEEIGVVTAQDQENTPQLANGVDVFISELSTFRSEHHEERIRALTGFGQVVLNEARLVLGVGQTDTSKFQGQFSGYEAEIGKVGTGTLILDDYESSNDREYFGDLVVYEGVLELRKSFINAGVDVQPSGMLTGYGTVSNLVAREGSTVFPLEMAASTVTLMPGSNYRAQLGSWRLGSWDTSLSVRQSATITGAILVPLLLGPVAADDVHAMIYLSRTATLNGAFDELPEGSQLTLANSSFRVSYQGQTDGSRSVTLTPGQFPLRLGHVTVAGGNGNGQVDPGECNDLFITLTNLLDTPLEGMRGVIRADTAGTAVTYPISEWPILPAHGSGDNQVSFQLRSESDLPCGKMLSFTLIITTPRNGTVVLPFNVATGTGLTPFRFDRSVAVPLNTRVIRSTNMISGFTTNLGKLTASIYLEHASLTNLGVNLISPRGKAATLLYRNGGANSHLGNNCSPESEQFVFDDDAPVAVGDITGPMVGAARPAYALSYFSGLSAEEVNGAWVLEVFTPDGPFNGTLHCWSLSATPVLCTPANGPCPSCLSVVTNSLTNAVHTMMTSFYGSDYPSVCGLPGTCRLDTDPSPPTDRYYRVHAFTNDGPETCVTVVMRRPGPTAQNRALQCFAFLDHFDPAQPCATYLADSASTTADQLPSFSFSVPAGARFEVAVLQGLYGQATGRSDYELAVYGIGCPPPNVAVARGAMPGTLKLSWPTTYPGWRLEQGGETPGFVGMHQSPQMLQGRYEVTQPVVPGCALFRLAR
jgi:autotransporter-associated beta strand protein